MSCLLVAASVEILVPTAIVVEGGGLALACNASGKPQPSVTWTKLGSSEVLSNTSSLTIVNVSRPGTPDNMIQYQCTASNGVKSPAAVTATISVHCKYLHSLVKGDCQVILKICINICDGTELHPNNLNQGRLSLSNSTVMH